MKLRGHSSPSTILHPQGVNGDSCAPSMAPGTRWTSQDEGAELELPCSLCPFLDLQSLLLSCHRKLGVCKLGVASAQSGRNPQIQRVSHSTSPLFGLKY